MKIGDVTEVIADSLEVGAEIQDSPLPHVMVLGHFTVVDKDKVLVSATMNGESKLYLLHVEEVEQVSMNHIPPVDMMGNTEGDLHEG